MYKTKFFKMVDVGEGSSDYFVCEETTPIPTAEEIVKRFEMHPDCKSFPVVEITREEFLQAQNALLTNISDSDLDMFEFSPNMGDLDLWRYWLAEG